MAIAEVEPKSSRLEVKSTGSTSAPQFYRSELSLSRNSSSLSRAESSRGNTTVSHPDRIPALCEPTPLVVLGKDTNVRLSGSSPVDGLPRVAAPESIGDGTGAGVEYLLHHIMGWEQ